MMSLHMLTTSRRTTAPYAVHADPDLAAFCRLLHAAVGAAFAVPIDEIGARTRGRPQAAFARQSAMYLVHIVLRLGYADVGALFGRDRTTAAHACRLVEERRDDPGIDALLLALEGVCADLALGYFRCTEPRA
jgi:hypothetical protein